MDDPNAPGGNPEGDKPAADPAAPPSPDGKGNDPGPVPYSRFKEVNDAKAEREAEIERMKEEHAAELEKVKAANKPEEDEWNNWEDETPLTKKDLKEWQDKQKTEQEEKETMQWYDNRHKELEKEIDGKDGRPAYKKGEIVAFVKKNPQFAFPDPLDVYNKLHFEKLVEHKADEKIKANKGGYVEKDKPPKEPAKSDTSKMSTKEHDAYVREKYSS